MAATSTVTFTAPRLSHAILFASLFAAAPAWAQHHHEDPPASEAPPTDEASAAETPRTPIAPLTDADRAAATRPLQADHEHDDAPHGMALVNRLETWHADGADGQRWEAKAWIGGDIDRVWLRSEGERSDGRLESADVELLYGRSIGPWWDVVAGVRQDAKPGRPQTFAAIGLQGLAPQKFEVMATLYVGSQGATAARLSLERDIPLVARWIAQPMVEMHLHDRRDRSRDIGAGLSSIEAGVRLRYEVTRRFAPYVGVVRERRYGAGGADGNVAVTQWVAGLRFWF